MEKRTGSLRQKFLIRVLSVLMIIAILSGIIQLFFMNKQIHSQTNDQAEMVAKGVISGVEDTKLASENIEHQIDLRLVAYAKQIALELEGEKPSSITSEELTSISNKLNIAGITLIAPNKEKTDLIGVVSTQKEELGFSFKKVGYYDLGLKLMKNEKPNVPFATFSDQNMIILPIAQSGSHENKDVFYKYAYYHPEGFNYIINPFMEANEVDQYVKKVGPEARIAQLVKQSSIVEEIAILNPIVFNNPDLEKQLYPPMKKMEAGTFEYKSPRDLAHFKKNSIHKTSYIENIKGKKVYKMFVPINDHQVVYLALDYAEMTGPLYRHSIILIISGLISLIALFLMTARFFNLIYENIQRIKHQIHHLEAGDLTAKSHVKDGGELEKLSESANRMVDSLNETLTDTSGQAVHVKRLSQLLEADAAQSVEKIYALSAEATIQSREQLYEIIDFLEGIKVYLLNQIPSHDTTEFVLKVEEMKEMAKSRTASTTDMTITLSDLLQSLHSQSSEMASIASSLMQYMSKFKL